MGDPTVYTSKYLSHFNCRTPVSIDRGKVLHQVDAGSDS